MPPSRSDVGDAPAAACLVAAGLGAAAAGALTGIGGDAAAASPTPFHPGDAAADTIVDGFHGYEFGAPGSRIGEIDASRPPDARVDGLEVFVRTVRFVGTPTRAYFYLDPVSHRLQRGKHLIEPDPATCVRQLTTLRLMVVGTHPDLEVETRTGGGAEPETAASGGPGAASSPCRDFLDGDADLRRTVLFRHPESGRVEARMELFQRGGEPRILACYLNESDCVWPDSVQVETGPKLLAPGRGGDTADAPRSELEGAR